MVVSIHANGAEHAFKLLCAAFPCDFVPGWNGEFTTEALLQLASKNGCVKLLNAVAKGALESGISLRKIGFEKALDLLGGVDASYKVNGKLIGVDVTLDYSQVTKKENKLLNAWQGQRQKLLKALGYSHIVILVWDVKSWVELTDVERGQLAEELLIHIEDRPPNSFCSELVLSLQ